MVKFDLQKTHDLACVGVLLANGHYPKQGTNYILADGTRQHFCYFDDSTRCYLKNIENCREYASAYLMAVFIEEARKEVPLICHELPNGKEIMVAANTPKEEVKDIIRKALQ